MKTFLLFFVFILVSCGGDNFTEKSKLSSLRVLAVVADTPEVNSASTVTLTPLVSYVDGAGVNLSYTWEACPDPGIDYGAEINCNSAVSATKLSGSGTFDTSTLAASYYTGNSTSISVAIPVAAIALLSNATSEIKYNGIDYIVLISFTDSVNGTSTAAIKRIKLSSRANTDLNLNPTLGNIQYDGLDLNSYPLTEGRITMAGTSSAEVYDKQTNIGLKSFTEKMYISWYSSTGEYLFNRTDKGESNTFTPSGTTGVFVAVYRDGRGGVATTQVSF